MYIFMGKYKWSITWRVYHIHGYATSEYHLHRYAGEFAAEVAHLMVDAGLIVITSFISPFRADRAMARSLFAKEEFLEVFIDTPLAVAESHDTKGPYARSVEEN